MAITAEVAETKQAKTAQKEGTEKKKLQEIGFFALCFFVPVLLMTFIWGTIGISYGGKVTLLTYDMIAEYMPFYASLRYILWGENSLLFSWSFYMGSNFMGAYALDAASPLAWITVLWSLANMPDAIYVLTLLKIGLSGLSFAFFTRFGLSKDSEKRCGIANVVFSCCYALMSYTVAYSVFLPWIEEVILLPLILLGIEKLLQGKKGFLYFVSIAGAFLCSYYISYMVGIFAAVYILCRVLAQITKENQKEMGKALFRFGAGTLLGLGINLPLLLPALWNLVVNLEERDMTPMSGAYAFSFWQLLRKLLPGQYDSMENWGLPSIYCGSIMVLLAVTYFFLKKYSLREKLSYVFLGAAPFLGFLFPAVDCAWHGFRYPYSAPYRYAFLFSTVILILAWKAYVALPTEGRLAKKTAVVLGGYLCVELFFNGTAIIGGIQENNHYEVRSLYDLRMGYVLPLVEEIRGEDGFFRAEVTEKYGGYSANILYGLKGIRTFHSAANEKVQNFLFAVGCQFGHGSAPSSGLSPLGDSLLGVKYHITDQKYRDGYEEIEEKSCPGFYLQENKNALSLGYLVDEKSMLQGCVFGEDVFENQNQILKAMGVEEPEVFQKLIGGAVQKKDGKAASFTILSDNSVYCYLLASRKWVVFDEATQEWDKIPEDVNVCLRGDFGEARMEWPRKSAKYMGNFKKGELLTLKVEDEDVTVEGIYAYELDREKYEAAMRKLKEGEFQITSLKGGHITGTVTAKQGQMLLLTIPADSGYHVKIDGKKSAYAEVLDTFLGVPLTEGEHQIEIDYIPPGLWEGIVIGLAAFVFAVVYYRRTKA